VEYFLDVDDDTGTEVHPDSVIAFFVNGECEQVAFADVQRGTYYPTGRSCLPLRAVCPCMLSANVYQGRRGNRRQRLRGILKVGMQEGGTQKGGMQQWIPWPLPLVCARCDGRRY